MNEVVEFDFPLASKVLKIIEDGYWVDIKCVVDQLESTEGQIMAAIDRLVTLERIQKIECGDYPITLIGKSPKK